MLPKIVRIATFSDSVEAELAKNRLEAAGINAFLSGQATAGAFAGLGGAFGTFDLHVAEADREGADKILTELEELEEPEGPAAHSSAITRHRPPIKEAIRKEEPDEFHTPAMGYNRADAVEFEEDDPGEDVEASEDNDEDEEDDPRSSVTWNADSLANRAWKAAILGCFLCPPFLNLYSIYTLLQLAALDKGPSKAGLRKLTGALIVNGFMILLTVGFVVTLLRR